jgi:hypothetical protein
VALGSVHSVAAAHELAQAAPVTCVETLQVAPRHQRDLRYGQNLEEGHAPQRSEHGTRLPAQRTATPPNGNRFGNACC